MNRKRNISGIKSLAEKIKQETNGPRLSLPSKTVIAYRIYSKYWEILSTYHIYPKILTHQFYYLLMCLKYFCMTNNVDPDSMPHSQYLGFTTISADVMQHSSSIVTTTRSQRPCIKKGQRSS